MHIGQHPAPIKNVVDHIDHFTDHRPSPAGPPVIFADSGQGTVNDPESVKIGGGPAGLGQ
jgi:hypothetical protein